MINLIKNLAEGQKKWIWSGLILHIVAAIFCVGYASPDEHFQLLEFANYKLGNISAVSLPWEYQEQMRPWAQPFIAYLFIKILVFFGIKSPFMWTLVLRLLSAVVGMYSLLLLYRACPRWLKEIKNIKFVLPVLVFTWFLPYLHARFNSENWSSLFFVIGVGHLVIRDELIRNRKEWLKSLLIIGFSFGLSFLFRYQIAFMILGAILWSLIIGKHSFKFVSLIVLTIVLTTVLGGVVDYWGYGEFVVAPWNYFAQNIIYGKAAQFSISPWWYYLKEAITYKAPPFGIIVAVVFIVGWIKFPRNIITWSSIPFIVVHFIIGHKELRFLYPVIVLAPVYLLLIMDWQESFFSNLTKNYVGKFFIYLIVGLNFIFLVVATFKPAKSAINFYQYLYKQDRKIDNLVAINYNPFDICGPNVANFYLKSVPKTNLIKDSSVNGLVNTPAPQWIFTERPKQALRIKKMFPECKTVYGVSPEWIEKFGLFKRFLLKQRVWNLFWCKSE